MPRKPSFFRYPTIQLCLRLSSQLQLHHRDRTTEVVIGVEKKRTAFRLLPFPFPCVVIHGVKVTSKTGLPPHSHIRPLLCLPSSSVDDVCVSPCEAVAPKESRECVCPWCGAMLRQPLCPRLTHLLNPDRNTPSPPHSHTHTHTHTHTDHTPNKHVNPEPQRDGITLNTAP